MYQSRQPAVSEDKFFELLQEDQDKKAFFHYLWETLGPEGQKWLSHRVLKNRTELPEGNVAFARMIGARQVTPEEKRALELNSLINHFSFRKTLLSSSFSAQEAAELLGVSRQTIHERIRNGQILGILENGVMKLPSWQFDAGGPNGVIEGLTEVLAAMDCSILAKISWLASESPVFNGDKPINALKNGQIDLVLREARAIGVA
ncbi:MAG: helix-turn-helix domain-containing protein [Candidatus Obscuribacter sp.]|nr:helix-turn-helix domain-containing protein [Candidatus Obscuribacter sp.]